MPQHIIKNPSTLIIRFYGFHRVQSSRSEKHYFVVMGNIFAQSLEIHERYDLKGSTLGRTVGERKLQQRNPKTIMKDLDFQRSFILGPQKRELFFKQLEEDCNVRRCRCCARRPCTAGGRMVTDTSP